MEKERRNVIYGSVIFLIVLVFFLGLVMYSTSLDIKYDNICKEKGWNGLKDRRSENYQCWKEVQSETGLGNDIVTSGIIKTK